jgi:hypothetical protein
MVAGLRQLFQDHAKNPFLRLRKKDGRSARIAHESQHGERGPKMSIACTGISFRLTGKQKVVDLFVIFRA